MQFISCFSPPDKNITVLFTRQPCAEGSALVTSLLQIWLRFIVNNFHLFICHHILHLCTQARLLRDLLVINQKPYWHQRHLYQACRYYRMPVRWVVNSYEVFITTGVWFHLTVDAKDMKAEENTVTLLNGTKSWKLNL